MSEERREQVDHPRHYNTGKIEIIDALEDWKLPPNLWNAVKYLARAGHKGSRLEDLRKGEWYTHREIQQLLWPDLTSKEAQAREIYERNAKMEPGDLALRLTYDDLFKLEHWLGVSKTGSHLLGLPPEQRHIRLLEILEQQYRERNAK